MTSYRVVIPEEEHGGFKFVQDELPGFTTVNLALDGFEPKVVFGWHLSVLIDYKNHIDKELPSPNEQKILYNFEGFLDALFKKEGNALFLARVTHGGQRELVWRIHKPELANNQLEHIIKTKSYPRIFDYRIDPDDTWEKTEWFISNARN